METSRKKRKLKRKFTRKMQIKLLAIFAFVLVLLVFLLMRIVYINLKDGKSYEKQVLSQENYDSRTLYSRRGEIQDRNGQLLAYSEKVYRLVIDCKEINKTTTDTKKQDAENATIEILSEQFDLDATELRDLIENEKTKDSQYQVLKTEITQDEKNAYEDYVSPDDDTKASLSKAERTRRSLVNGVWFEEQFIRKYPLNTVASNVVGFSNQVGDGITGLELYYDSLLGGTSGRVFGYLNEDQEYEKKTIAPENGYTLQTTLDVNIQEIVEKYIQEFDEEYGTDEDNGTAKHGAKDIGVIAMDPNDGSVLAMATNHGYDLNNPQDLSAWYTESEVRAMTDEEKSKAMKDVLWDNYCITDGIEPGSTFKPVTIAAALETGAISENDSFYCDGGEQVTDTFIRCDVYPGAHGAETLEDVLKNSCNDALMAIGAKMGIANFIQYQSLFNFGSKTGIDLPEEIAGIVYDQKGMNEVELATCTFGQGFTCTMIQQIAAFCTVVNGGYYYQPHVVEKVLDENGKIIKSSDGMLLKQPISNHVSSLLRQYLEATVSEGTGRMAQVPGYRVGGKTGTAEKIDYTTGTRAAGKYLVSFIGAVPINDPQVVLYVVVDEPNVADQAHSTYAQEIFRKIATEMLPYMGIYQTEEITDELLAYLGLDRSEVTTTDSVVTFDAIDANGNYHTDARVENGQVVDGDGNILSGVTINEQNHVIDAYGNDVFTITDQTAAEDPDPKVDNPNIATPPEQSAAGADAGSVWDGTALGDDTAQ